jgi:hypothetical protein
MKKKKPAAEFLRVVFFNMNLIPCQGEIRKDSKGMGKEDGFSRICAPSGAGEKCLPEFYPGADLQGSPK